MRIALAPLLAGCHAIQAFEPPPPPGALVKSAIVIFEAEELEVFALDLGEADPLTRPFAADKDAILTLLYLPDDLPSMLLSPGRIEPSVGPPERSFPPFLEGYRSERMGELLRWRGIDELSDGAAGFRFAGFDVNDCAEVGGCFIDPEHAERVDCNVPCTTDEPVPPEPAEPPMTPSLEPCPAGWSARPIAGAVVCEPTADRCPAGQYRDDLPADAIRVDPALTTIAAAIAGAQPGDTIALSKGVHAGNAVIDQSVSILGACAAQTIIQAAPGEIGLIANADLTLTDVGLRGGDSALLVAAGTSSVSRVVIEQSARGLFVDGGELIARDLSVRDTAAGIVLLDATADLSGISIERSAEYGMAVDSSTVTARDVVVQQAPTGIDSVDSNFTLIRAQVLDLVWEGVSIRGAGSFTTLDLSIRRAVPPFSYSIGLRLSGTARSMIDRYSAAEIDGEGFHSGGDAVAMVQDVTITADGSTPDALGTQCGFNAAGKSQVFGRRIHLQDLLRQGLCSNDEANTDLTDITAIAVGDHALYVFQEASLKVARARVDGAADGVVAFLRTTLDVSDLTVANMHGNVRYVPTTMLGYPRGRGIYNNAMASVKVERFRVTGCADAGLDLSSRDSVSLSNGVVTGNQIGARITYDPKHLLQRLRVSGNELNFAGE